MNQKDTTLTFLASFGLTLLLLSPFAVAQEIELRVVDEVAPAGGMALILVELTEPEPISGGHMRFQYGFRSSFTSAVALSVVAEDDILGEILKVDLLSRSDDVSGTATIEGGQVFVELESQNFTFGTDLDLPLLAIAIPVSPSATPGESLPIEIDLGDSEFLKINGENYIVDAKQGTFTVGGTAISEMQPSSGLVSAGSTIVLRGVGFQAGADINIEEADVDHVRFISSEELRVTVEQGFEIRNTTRVRLRNPDDSEEFFYPIRSLPPSNGPPNSVEFVQNSLSIVGGTSADITVAVELGSAQSLQIGSSNIEVLQVPELVSVGAGKRTIFFRVFGSQPGSATLSASIAQTRTEMQVIVAEGTAFVIPVLRNDSTMGLGIGLTNRDQVSSEIHLRGFPRSGGETIEAAVSLEPLHQTALLLDQYDVRFRSFQGWVEVSSFSRHVHALFINVPFEIIRYAGSAGDLKSAEDIAVPLSGFDPEGEHEVVFVNNNLNSAQVTLDWLDAQGGNLDSTVFEIEPQGSYSRALSDLFSSLPDQFGGTYIRILSSQPLEPYHQMSSLPLLFGEKPDSSLAGASAIYLPQFVLGEEWDTEVQLVNLASQVATVSLKLVQDDGDLTESEPIQVPAGAVIQVNGTELFQAVPGSLLVGSAIIETPGNVIASAIFGRKQGTGLATTIPTYTEGFAEAVFAQVASGQFDDLELFTGAALHNPNSAAVLIMIQVFSASGQLTAETEFTLEGGMRTSQLLSQLIPGFTSQTGGHVYIKSSLPILIAQMFGDYALNFLSTVPASYEIAIHSGPSTF